MTRLALVGAGWAGRVHALAVAESSGATIVAVSAGTVGGAEELASTIQAKPVSTDRLPAGADAVVIATPTATHATLACALLGAGVPVLIEQPLALTLADADAIVNAAERTATAACYAANLLFSPALDLAAARRRELGDLAHLEVRISQPAPDRGAFGNRQAGGSLVELGTHALSVALVLAGEDSVVGVRCRLESSDGDGADDAARVELRFASDLIASLDLDQRGTTPHWSAQAASARGVVRVEFQPVVGVEVDGEPIALPAGPSTTDPRVRELGYADQLEGFASMVAGRGGRVCPAGFGRAVLDIISAAYASAGAGGDEVDVPFGGDRSVVPMHRWRIRRA